jgi:hypothetical protein
MARFAGASHAACCSWNRVETTPSTTWGHETSASGASKNARVQAPLISQLAGSKPRGIFLVNVKRIRDNLARTSGATNRLVRRAASTCCDSLSANATTSALLRRTCFPTSLLEIFKRSRSRSLVAASATAWSSTVSRPRFLRTLKVTLAMAASTSPPSGRTLAARCCWRPAAGSLPVPRVRGTGRNQSFPTLT